MIAARIATDNSQIVHPHCLGWIPVDWVALSATVNGALLPGQEQYLGRLKSSFAADIAPVDGDSLRDIRALTHNVKCVMKNGEVVVDLGR